MAISQIFFSKSGDFGAFFKQKSFERVPLFFCCKVGKFVTKKDHAKATGLSS
jgi:hypothetical protein